MEEKRFLRDNRVYCYRQIDEKILPVEFGYAKAVSFTGHRPDSLLGYVSMDKYAPIIQIIIKEVLKSYREGYRKYISGGAQGFDQLAFTAVRKAVCKYNLKDVINAVYVPFVGQESLWSTYGTFSKDSWYSMLESADEVRIINKQCSPINPYYEIVAALDSRNKAMLRDSSKLIAWYNGAPKGGTLNCLKDAISLGLDVVNIYSDPRRC